MTIKRHILSTKARRKVYDSLLSTKGN